MLSSSFLSISLNLLVHHLLTLFLQLSPPPRLLSLSALFANLLFSPATPFLLANLVRAVFVPSQLLALLPFVSSLHQTLLQTSRGAPTDRQRCLPCSRQKHDWIIEIHYAISVFVRRTLSKRTSQERKRYLDARDKRFRKTQTHLSSGSKVENPVTAGSALNEANYLPKTVARTHLLVEQTSRIEQNIELSCVAIVVIVEWSRRRGTRERFRERESSYELSKAPHELLYV